MASELQTTDMSGGKTPYADLVDQWNDPGNQREGSQETLFRDGAPVAIGYGVSPDEAMLVGEF